MNILLTFAGFHDPYALGLVGEEGLAGPILSLVGARTFDRVIIVSTPNTETNTAACCSALTERHPRMQVEARHLPLTDPTNYVAILKALRKCLGEIIESTPGATYFVSVASGTPQMHACWVLLVASGELPAHILHIRPPRFVTKDLPLVSEIDLAEPEFPVVRTKTRQTERGSDEAIEVATVVTQLGIVGEHPALQRVVDFVATLAQSNAPILLLGETGTGKELFAKLVHLLSGRPVERFVPINCASLPKDLVESILFGHKKGTFTGASSDHIGKFVQADGGTLFLDELGELPLAVQAKLLRVLQDGLVEPLGSSKAQKVDVRVVGATNRDLASAMKSGEFRADLYHRLNVGLLRLPSLRERRSDIPKIALHILDRLNATLQRPKRLSPGALARLQNHTWPGNVRDLENVLERSARFTKRDVLEVDDLLIVDPITTPDEFASLPQPGEGFSLEQFIASARKQLMLKALDEAKGNQSQAAKLLGISPQAVHKFLRDRSSSST
jgi:transcriptional regulator with GAF, ATPase, and Fis domain